MFLHILKCLKNKLNLPFQEKCVDYLPPSEVLDCNRLFGDFQVTLKKRDVKDKYIISNLQLKVTLIIFLLEIFLIQTIIPDL